MSSNREIKNNLFEHVARLTKAVANPKRLELIELLCQTAKPVEALAREAGISVKLASAHLKELRLARLVTGDKHGKQVIYRLASPDVARLWVLLHTLAEDRLFELQEALRQLAAGCDEWEAENRESLLRKASRGEIVVIDVRPACEFAQWHLPNARSLPLNELHNRLAELPRDKPIVAYCRGPYCLMSSDAVRLLHEQGYQAMRLKDGIAEWMHPA